MTDELSFDEFLRVDIRVGTIVDVQPFPEAGGPPSSFGSTLG